MTSATSRELRVDRLSEWQANDPLGSDWNDLVASSASASAFLTREWLQSWWCAFGGSSELFLLGVRTQDGEVLGVAPLYRSERRILPGVELRVLRLVGDGSGDSDNLDWIVRRGEESACVRAVLAWLEQHPKEWDVLDLNTMPENSAVHSVLREEVEKRNWTSIKRNSPQSLLNLPATWDAYLAAVSKNMRASISSRMRKLEKQSKVRFWRCETEAELPRCLDLLFGLHGRRWESRGEAGSFSVEARRKFYDEMALAFLREGRLDFWLLDVDEVTVAAEFGFRFGNTYSFLQGGFDPSYGAQSVGLVLKAMIMRELISAGVARYDFLGGADAYKSRWGAQTLQYQRLRCARPHTRGACYLSATDRAERGKAWIRARVPEGAWFAARNIYRKVRPAADAGSE